MGVTSPYLVTPHVLYKNITIYIMKITINKKKYEVKYTIRAIFLFEQITKAPFEIKTITDSYIFFYCMLLANNPDNVIEWDEFIEALDNDKKLYEQLNKVMLKQQEKDKMFEDNEEESGEEKKS